VCERERERKKNNRCVMLQHQCNAEDFIRQIHILLEPTILLEPNFGKRSSLIFDRIVGLIIKLGDSRLYEV
jgi:hypothetical protein